MDTPNEGTIFTPQPYLRFSLSEISGRWRSRSGAPCLTVYRNTARKGGGYRVAFSYDADTVLQCPVRQYWGYYYFDLYGWIRLRYDRDRDVLNLSGYGDYYREEE